MATLRSNEAMAASMPGLEPRIETGQAHQILIVRAETSRSLAFGEVEIRVHNGPVVAAEMTGHSLGDLALDSEHVGSRTVPAVAPQASAARGIEQLRRNADLIALLLQRTLQRVARTELAREAAHFSGPAFVFVAGFERDHVEVAKAPEIGDDVLGQAVRQPHDPPVAAEVLERQNHDGRGFCCRGSAAAGPFALQ